MKAPPKMPKVIEPNTYGVDHVVHEFVYRGAFEPGLSSVPHDFSVIS